MPRIGTGRRGKDEDCDRPAAAKISVPFAGRLAFSAFFLEILRCDRGMETIKLAFPPIQATVACSISQTST
jgi:hypothetical protein